MVGVLRWSPILVGFPLRGLPLCFPTPNSSSLKGCSWFRLWLQRGSAFYRHRGYAVALRPVRRSSFPVGAGRTPPGCFARFGCWFFCGALSTVTAMAALCVYVCSRVPGFAIRASRDLWFIELFGLHDTLWVSPLRALTALLACSAGPPMRVCGVSGFPPRPPLGRPLSPPSLSALFGCVILLRACCVRVAACVMSHFLALLRR